MKYLKVPCSGQYNVNYETYILLDKIVSWENHYIYVLGGRNLVRTDWTAEEIEREIRKVEES